MLTIQNNQSKWLKIFDLVMRPLFGDDIFISYSRRDSAYVLKIANMLVERGISPYVDQWASPIGATLPWSLRRALARANMLLVVASEQSAKSENVEREIKEFISNRRAICVINIADVLASARWASFVPGIEPISETQSALLNASPSENVIDRVLSSARFVRSKKRIRVLALAALMLIFVSFMASSYFGQQAIDRQQQAKSLELAGRSVEVVAVNPLTGLRLALQAYETAQSPEAESAVRNALASPRPSKIIPGRFRDVDFGSDVMFTIDDDSKLLIWDYKTGQGKYIFGATDIITAEWNQSGSEIVTTSRSGRVEVWDVNSGERIWTLEFEPGNVRHASFGEEDATILTAHKDGSVRRNSLTTPSELLAKIEVKGSAERVWFLGNIFTIWLKPKDDGYVHEIFRLDKKTNKLVALGPFPMRYIDPPVRPSERYFILPDQIQNLYRFEETKDNYSLSGRHLAVRRDGSAAITASSNTATIWNFWTKQAIVKLPIHDSDIIAAKFSRDGQILVTLTKNGILRVWPYTNRILYTKPDRPILKRIASMDISKDESTLVLGDVWGDFLLWDLQSGEVRDLMYGAKTLSAARTRVTFDLSGDQLMTSTEGGEVGIWKWRTRELIFSHQLPDGSIPKFSLDSQVVVTAPDEGGAIVFNTKTGSLQLFDEGTKFTDLAPVKDGAFIVAADITGNVTVHRARDWKIVARLEKLPEGSRFLEVDDGPGNSVLVFNQEEAYVWQWRSSEKADMLKTDGLPIRAVNFDAASSLLSIATQMDVRLYNLDDLSLIQRLDDSGRENDAVVLRHSDHLIATAQMVLGTGEFVLLRSCEACVERGRLVEHTRKIINKLAEEQKAVLN